MTIIKFSSAKRVELPDEGFNSGLHAREKKVVECSQYKIISEIEKFRNGSLEQELSKRLSN